MRKCQIGGNVLTRTWGDPGTPLAPLSLRQALGATELPIAVRDALNLPAGATVLALDESPWSVLTAIPEIVWTYIEGLVRFRRADIAKRTVLATAWPAELDPMSVAWPKRIRRFLEGCASSNSATRLSGLVYSDLLDAPGVGSRTVLVFATMADAACREALEGKSVEALVHDLADLEAAHWTERIWLDDPRFAHVLPPYSGTLAELFEDLADTPEHPMAVQLATHLRDFLAMKQSLDAAFLEDAATDLFRALMRSERNGRLVAHRFGLTEAGTPQTLRETGEAFGITRERVRQLERRLRDAEALHEGMYLPQLERGLDLIAHCAPLSVSKARSLVQEEGISRYPLHPEVLIGLSEVFGVSVPIELHGTPDEGLVLPIGSPNISGVMRVARKQASRVGVSNIEEVHAELASDEYSVDDVRSVLDSSGDVTLLVNDWFWVPSIATKKNRLRNVARKVLAVTESASLESMRAALRRRLTFYRIDVLPPVEVLGSFFRDHPEFDVAEGGNVRVHEDCDEFPRLSDVEAVLVDVLSSVPSGLLARRELEERAVGNGVNPNTFAVYTSYSPILENPAPGIWCLRGSQYAAAQLEALRELEALRAQGSRKDIEHQWTADGHLEVVFEVRSTSSPVVTMPAAVRPYLAGRDFDALTLEGSSVGSVRVNDAGSSWGYGRFFRRRGTSRGDYVAALFNLEEEQVTLSHHDGVDE